MKKEIWKQVRWYKNCYLVSSLGKIKRIGKGQGVVLGRILKQYPDKDGYKTVVLTKNCIQRMKKVHHLVLQSFVAEKRKGRQTNHKNGIKSDNRAENLEWVTGKENIQHSYENGFHPRGEDHWASKLKNHQVLEIRKRTKAGEVHQDIANFFGICRQLVSEIGQGKRWKHLN